MERPPRTRNPGPLQQPQLCETHSSGGGVVVNHAGRRPPAPVQRPPRVEPPAPFMERPPRTDAPVPVERPPRTDAPPPAERPPRSNPPPLMRRPPQTSPQIPVQRPPRTGPPAPLQSPGRDFSASMQRPPRTDNPAPVSEPSGYDVSSLLHRITRPLRPNPEPGSFDSSPKPISASPPRDERLPVAPPSVAGCSRGTSGQSLTCGGFIRGVTPDNSDDSEEGAVEEEEIPKEEGAGGIGSSFTSEEDPELFITVDEQNGHDEDPRKRKRKREDKPEEDSKPPPCDLDQDLDRALEDRAKHHNLTAVNVRNILHEVITNEHVVAMMKAAITDTEGLPMFEPKMTRSKLKEVVERGVVIPTWNLSPIKKANKLQVPQFVDIHLEEEDSSDEEYCPEEEEEDETAEESLLESDVESTASSPRGHKRPRLHHLSESQEEDSKACQQSLPPAGLRHISAEMVPMGPPPPPKVKLIQDNNFMEKLHAVDEELDSNPVSMNSFQTLDDSLIAFRTRSKKPLKNVPIGQLEAELRAPDITPDMYDPNTADDDNWKMWLRGLMQDDVGNEDDDDDDPEYNILEDWDEPDTEDLRNDRAVRITKKEVNELMEELFETFQDEMGISHLEEEGLDDEDSNTDPLPDFNTPQAIRFEEPLANLLTEQHRTVRAQLEFLRMRKSMSKTEEERSPVREAETPKPLPPPKLPLVMSLDAGQKKRLQQQMQQHVQLLTQVHLLTFRNPRLSQEADTAQMYLAELSHFAERSTQRHRPLIPDFHSMFEPCNLRDALQLLPLVHSHVPEDIQPPKPLKKNVNEITNLPKHIAWIMATRPLFMYPELVPICAMKARGPRDRVYFTKAEDNLLALGLKHFEGTDFSKQLISKYLLPTKTSQQLTVRIKNLTMKKTPENIFKFYKRTKVLPALSRCCEDVQPHDWRPPVEREKHRLPFWMKASLSSIEAEIRKLDQDSKSVDSKYPLLLPPGVNLTLKPLQRRFYRKTWRQKCLKPLLIRPSPSANCVAKPPLKPLSPQTLPISVLQPAVPVHGIFGIPVGQNVPDVCVSVQTQKRPAPVSNDVPVTYAKAGLSSSAATQKMQKPYIDIVPKKRIVSKESGVRVPPIVHSGPLLFAVPNGAVKLVRLGPPCSVLHPVNTGSGVHVATVLLNSTQIPINQNFNPTLVTLPSQVHQSNNSSCEEQGLQTSMKKDDVEWDCVSITIKVEAETEERPGEDTGEDISQPEKRSGEDTRDNISEAEERPDGDNISQPEERPDGGNISKPEERPSGDNKPQPEERSVQETGNDISQPEGRPGGDDKPKPEVRPEEDVGDYISQPEEKPVTETENDISQQEERPKDNRGNCISQPEERPGGNKWQPEATHCKDTGHLASAEKNEVDSGQKLDPKDKFRVSKTLTMSSEPVDMQDSDDVPEEDNTLVNQPLNQQTTVASDSPKNTSSSTDGEVEVSSPADIARGASSPLDGQEISAEKGVPEEEDEEDFDLTQDEDEMSSASEESVLSVPELQETMEKLTWLASERRLSQEGDSEDNSQEEITEAEEEEEEESVQEASQKAEAMASKAGDPEHLTSHMRVPSPAPVEERTMFAGERRRGGNKGQSSHRARSRRGRGRTSKDTSKLRLMYDEKILMKDPQREQKDMAYAQSYLTRVQEALRSAPGTYEEFLSLIYEFERRGGRRTALDLYESLRQLLRHWPQLLKDFAAFLLPEQALECGLFEEQQAFDKSRRFLRQLEICFLENPSQHQKIIKLLQSCAECPLQEMAKLKTQMWQLLKGHVHLQEEFSLFFEQLRPPASHMEDFEVMNWTEDKDYKFDGFEEVTLPDVEEEEEIKMPSSQRSKRRKEAAIGQDKDVDWLDCSCSCHDVGTEPRMKRCKRRTCAHCTCKKPTDVAGHMKDAGSRSTASDERPATGSRVTGSRALSTPESSVAAQRPRSHARDSKQRYQSKDNSRATPRGAKRHYTVKGPHLMPEKEIEDTAQPITSPSDENDKPGTSREHPTRCPTPPTPTSDKPPTGFGPKEADFQLAETAEREEQTLFMCAKNITVSSSGEKVILWTREADRVILTMCQERGADDETFEAISVQLGNKSASEVAQRFQELMSLFQTVCGTSSDEEED